MKRSAALIVSMMFAVVPAGAATLSTMEGDVLVNSGNGFARAKAGQELRAGDRVMVGARGGSAAIAYNQACVEQVQRGHVVAVKPVAPCAAESGDGRDSLKDRRAAAGGAGAGGGGAGGAAAAGAAGIPNTALVAGGVALAVGAGVGIYYLTKPSSP